MGSAAGEFQFQGRECGAGEREVQERFMGKEVSRVPRQMDVSGLQRSWSMVQGRHSFPEKERRSEVGEFLVTEAWKGFSG